MKKKKKILFIMNTMGRAGAERALIALIHTFPKEKYDIFLQVLVNRGEIFKEVPRHVHLLVKHPDTRSVLSAGGRFKLFRTVLYSFFYHANGFRLKNYMIRNLKYQLKKKKLQPDKLFWRLIACGTKTPGMTFDLAVAYLEGGSTYYLADRVSAKKKAAFIHIDYKTAGYHRGLDLDAYAKIDRIFSVSKEAGESFLKVYPEYKDKLFLFRNIIDTRRIKKYSLRTLPKNDPFLRSRAEYKLLTVGRLHYQKAYDIAIPALKRIREQGYDVDWFVLGEGPLEKELKKQIQEEGLAGHFHLLGSRANPYPYYRACDLYVHVTRFEGKSIAIEEAQVLGKAIIASDCTGNREQISSGENGLLIPLTKEHIAAAVISLLRHPEQRKIFEAASKHTDLNHKEDRKALLSLLENKETVLPVNSQIKEE